MLNFIPKKLPAVNLLYGKTPLQRIRIGKHNHILEIPLAVIESLYRDIDTSKEYMNRTYNPLKWRSFVDLKLKALYLYESATSTAAPTTALSDLSFYPKLTEVYLSNLAAADRAAFQCILNATDFDSGKLCMPTRKNSELHTQSEPFSKP